MTQQAQTSTLGDVRETLGFALPVTLSRVGLLALVIVDTIMTGRLGANELAYYALAMAFMLPMMMVGVGVLMGTVVLTAQAIGAGNAGECGGVWRVSMAHGAAYGGLAFALCYVAEPFLLATGPAPGLARGASGVMMMFTSSASVMARVTAFSTALSGTPAPRAMSRSRDFTISSCALAMTTLG